MMGSEYTERQGTGGMVRDGSLHCQQNAKMWNGRAALSFLHAFCSQLKSTTLNLHLSRSY